MVSCASCKGSIDEVFLEKIAGTHVKVKGKKVAVCSRCQAAYSMEELRDRLR